MTGQGSRRSESTRSEAKYSCPTTVQHHLSPSYLSSTYRFSCHGILVIQPLPEDKIELSGLIIIKKDQNP